MKCVRCNKACLERFFCSDKCASEFWDEYDSMGEERRTDVQNNVIKGISVYAHELLEKAIAKAKKNPPSECGIEKTIAEVREGIFAGREEK
jgi:hypothetical protein